MLWGVKYINLQQQHLNNKGFEGKHIDSECCMPAVAINSK